MIVTFLRVCCLLSLFYIKPQQVLNEIFGLDSCLLSLFYIKPQLSAVSAVCASVVFYLYSTSNHNYPEILKEIADVVFYLYSTSNHN